MQTQISLVQSLLRGVFAPAIFALTAVLVSANAAAQSPELCDESSAVSSIRGVDPHESNRVCLPEHSINTVPNSILCAQCIPDTTCNPPSNFVLYSKNEKNYCGTRSQCEAVSGITREGATCARTVADCGADQIFTANESGTGGICEACEDGQEPHNNVCECPMGQRENADGSACEAIPSSGGGDDSSGGSAAVLVAVPVLLFGAYWLIDGVDKVEPAYNFSYSGENENFHYTGNAGFNLQHGGLHSYASAVQSNGDGIEYHSGISYERDYLALNYDGVKSDGKYAYDLAAQIKAELGLWTIAPAASAEFQYQTGEEVWKSDVSTGLETAWTAQKWTMRARSDFAGDSGHALDLELKF